MKKSIFLFFAAILCAMTANAACYLKGGFNDWSTANEMAVSGTTATCTIDLAGSTTFEFKVHNGSSWHGSSSTVTSTATTITLNGGSNAKITTTIPGTYTFSFNTSTKKLTVTYPEVPAPHDITVRAKVPASWTNTITAWVWTSENSEGTEVTPEKEGDYYVVTKNAGALYVIYKNGTGWTNQDKNQTVDLCYTEDVCLQLNQSGTAKATATVIDCGAVSKDITVKAVVPGAWEDKITAWVWPTGGEGKEVTPTKEGNWYVITENCIELNVIFKNGEGWKGNEHQTANIEGVSENTCYQISALTKDGDGKCTYTVVDCEATIEPEAKPEDVYTIVGTATLVGTAWDLNNTDNDMTKQTDGSYVLVKEDVELTTTGTYEYKVVKNRSWDWKDINSGNNITLTSVEKDGIYDVTFTLNKELNALSVNLELIEETKIILDCYVSGDESLVGTGKGWNADAVVMTYNEDTEVYTATLSGVPAGTHNMKVVYGGAWLGYDKLSTPAPANVSEGEDNKIQFILEEAGDVTVTYHATNGIGLTGNFAAPVTYDYYLAGSLVGGWSATQQGIEKDGDVYKATFTNLAVGEYEFKITDGQFNSETETTHEHTTLGAVYEEVSGGNGSNIKITLEAATDVTVIFDATNDKITFEGLTEKTEALTFTVTVPAGTEKCYICGDMNSWNAATAIEMEDQGSNVFSVDIVGATKEQEYKYLCAQDWAYVEKTAEGEDVANRKWGDNDVVAAWGAPAEPVEMASVVLMGVEDDWTTGIAMELNPDDANEYMLLCQSITADEPIKIKAVDTQSNLTWCAKLADTSLGTVEKDAEGNENIVLEEGKYDFYYKVAENEVWIGTCATTEPEYIVVEDVITNFVFNLEAWPMVCSGGPSTTHKIEVYLTLDGSDGTLDYEECSVAIMGTDATFIDGTLSNIDPYAPSADAVLHVIWGEEEYYELKLAMSSTPAEAITIEAEDATVTLTEYPTNFEATEFAYELNMVANWVNEAESLPYTVEFVIPTFDPTKASGEYNANFYVTGEGDAFGMNEKVSVTVTKDGNNVTLTGNVSALNGNAYNVTISGTLPVEEPDYTRTVASGSYGTICLPNGSSKVEGAKFYEVTYKKDGYIYADEVTTLVAGMPYIFHATSTEIKVYYNETTAAAGSKNGVYGTFSDITDGDAGTAGNILEGNYLLVAGPAGPAGPAVQKCGGNCSLAANRAYFVVSEITTKEKQPLPGRQRIALGCQEENQATGLDNITENGTIAPAMQGTYDILGRQLSEPAANGFYIINGKKMFVVK